MDGQGSATRISFRNDYSEGAHPRLLQALAQASAEQHAGYGTDRHTARAVALIRTAVAQPQADVHLLVGGTQTNLIAISAFLRPHQAVIAVDAAHIATHETGAIEATGHKVLTVPALHDKLTPALIQPVLAVHSNEHMVQPRLVYISNSTESGTIYTRAELDALSRFCRANDLLLYLDGARLGAALTADGNDLDLPAIATLTDAFYIGGTKNGALLGEALVIVNPALQADLRYLIKQRGALLAKGMVLGAWCAICGVVRRQSVLRTGCAYQCHGATLARRPAGGRRALHQRLADQPAVHRRQRATRCAARATLRLRALGSAHRWQSGDPLRDLVGDHSRVGRSAVCRCCRTSSRRVVSMRTRGSETDEATRTPEFCPSRFARCWSGVAVTPRHHRSQSHLQPAARPSPKTSMRSF
ncbi:beta-eliminating lyase-related protein [Xanthomonas citri pv. citri]|uniref:threonine aldolase family protein n=1 Tax=Xanthomonas citri TaxID=346 RepID=UPI0036DB452D